ncbi:MAG: DUF1338 family protein [Sphingobium sp.]
MNEEKLIRLLSPVLGERAQGALAALAPADGGGAMPPERAPERVPERVGAADLAYALSVALHQGLLDRVPTGRAYVAERLAAGGRVMLDHGALRTIRLPGGESTGALPAGAAAFARLLEPLGYRRAGVYPLDRLKMTGYAWCHAGQPQALAQYFVSELHVERFSPEFQAAARRLFGTTRDPLTGAARASLDRIAAQGWLAMEEAAALLPVLAGTFDRHHDVPALADYEALKQESAEAAWIATEGNAFNHGTDRVDDLDATVAAQRAAGRAMKDRIEVSGNGRVRQTATRADRVDRPFIGADGQTVTMSVPGSFYEFISRDVDPETGALDLRFDSGNAQGIFRMTALDA